MIKWVKIRKYERGFLFREGELQRYLHPGRYWVFDPLFKVTVCKVSVRRVELVGVDVELVARSGLLEGEARVLDLKDHERALVWVDGRFDGIYGPGRHVLWAVFHELKVEMVDARIGNFQHDELAVVLAHHEASTMLDTFRIEHGQVALLKVDGRLSGVLQPGRYAFWREVASYEVQPVDMREQSVDIGGQELMTADKVTLRLNAIVTVRVVDPERALTEVDNYAQALYREAQLALRAVIGAQDLEVFLTDKERVVAELAQLVRQRAEQFGVKVVSFGIKDVILPGEMKAILNRVTEAKKAAEADLITRREETAAIRSQANTARIIESNPGLMRLRELEVLEKVADKANLSVILGESGLTDRIVKLL